MSKQPRSAREYREKLAAMGVMLPADKGDPRQLWLLVRQDPTDQTPGCFFVTHGANFDKFDKRPGFEILGHSWDRSALTLSARRATEVCGPQYQPKFSVKPTDHVQKPDVAHEEGDDFDWSSEASRLANPPFDPNAN